MNKKKERQPDVPSSLTCCGGTTRTYDLWVMSPTSYQLLHSAMFSLKCGAKVRYYFDIAKCFLSFLCFVTYLSFIKQNLLVGFLCIMASGGYTSSSSSAPQCLQ